MSEPLPSFAVNWDYLCPFARNVHEHLLTGLGAGAQWDVSFVAFSLMQSHVPEGGTPVWDEPTPANGLLALQAGVTVRDRFPELFPTVHGRLFAARHDEGQDLREEAVVRSVLTASGVPDDEIFAAIKDGWPLDTVRREHEESVGNYSAFGVPTFITEGRAAFVRVMTRPRGDGSLARSTIERLVRLVAEEPELNELKHTTIPR